MKFKFTSLFIILFCSLFLLTNAQASTTSGSIDTTNKYAWGNHIAWINFKCDNCNVVITDSVITGYAWSANYGWIILDPSNGGITNDGTGNLDGDAWGENIGYIDFDGVSIDSSGVFSGTATTDNLGSIVFTGDNVALTTDWRPQASRPACNNSSDDDGDGLTDYPNDPGCSSLTDTDETDESSGGAFIPPSIPVIGMIGTDEVDFEIKILEGNQVKNKNITLKFIGISNVEKVAISENSSFSGTSWETYSSQKSFTLSSNSGTKMLYIKFRSDEGGVSAVYTKSVVLVDDGEVIEIPVVEPDMEEIPKQSTSPEGDIKEECYNFVSYLTIGHSSDEVLKLQELLEDLGHFTYSAGPTGYFGNVTKVAVISFQKAKNLSPYPGYVGPGTRKALNESCGKIPASAGMTQEGQDDKKPIEKPKVDTDGYQFTSYLYLNDSGDEVLKLQQILEDLGYFEYVHGPTGYFGGVTKDAVIKFQKAKNLSPYPGWIGPGTRKALNSL